MILVSPMKRFVRLSMPLVCSLVLALVLVACGGGSATSSAPVTQPAAEPQPTSAPNTTTYTGNGFTIDYPQDWKVSTPSANEVIFNNPSNTVALAINVTDNPNGLSAADRVSGTLQKFQSDPKYPNFQTVDMPATTTVDGETWSQGAYTYDMTTNGQPTSFESVLLIDNYSADPSMPKAFIIVYGAPTNMFDQVMTDTFQSMLDSFAFA